MDSSQRQYVTDVATSITSIPNYVSSAVLDHSGTILQGQLSPNDASILFQMIVEAGSLNIDLFRRLTVTFQSMRYVVTIDETRIYMVKTQVQ